MKKSFGLILVLVLAGGGWYFAAQLLPDRSLKPLPPAAEYEARLPNWRVGKIADNLGPITRLKLSPDGQLLFAATLTGKVWVLRREDGQWQKQAKVFYEIKPGFTPGVENGLTGLILSSEFATNRQLFLLYARKGPTSRENQNQILRLTVGEKDGELIGVNPTVIYSGLTPTAVSHQIQGGISLKIEGKPHLLFSVGDTYFNPQYAKDLTKEAGKLILIQEDGSDPLGARPYPLFPKIQAVGLRNSYDLALDPTNNWIYLSGNGPEINDTIAYVPLLDPSLKFDFNWSGDGQTLTQPLVNNQPRPEYIIKHWETTVAPVDIASYQPGQFILNVFSTDRYPKKEIILGTHRGTQEATLQTLASRKEGIDGGNPLGLAVGSEKELYFGDFYDGAIYLLYKK